MDARTKRPDTLLTHAGRHSSDWGGAVNPPVYHVSTVLFDTMEELQAKVAPPAPRMRYGRLGTPTSFAFEEAVAAIEGADRSIALPSGLAAITAAMMAFLKTGDHVLIPDNVYGPTRSFCLSRLARLGIETTVYDPLRGAAIAELMRPNTRIVYTEAPGSQTFEMPDIPAIAKAAHAGDAVVILDNTWATPIYFQPFAHGVDVSVHAATKYMVGHSDAMMGVISTIPAHRAALEASVRDFGFSVSGDDCYLALRGLRTMGVRLARHQESGIRLARWLADRPEVRMVMHPALPQDPGHQIWSRDFTGASGLFGFVLQPTSDKAVAAMAEGLELFGMGYSWGGFESLFLPCHPESMRSVTTWDPGGTTVRVHAGLEDADDLIADLEAGFARLKAAG